jgi:hypothetical protein
LRRGFLILAVAFIPIDLRLWCTVGAETDLLLIS